MSSLVNSPLLLLHGFPMDARMWRHAIAHFGPRRRVIAPNAAELVANGPSMAGMARAALNALETEAPGQPAVVVGLSMGGYIAAKFAHDYPDRLAALVLCDTRATAETTEGRASRDHMVAAVRAAGVVSATSALVGKLLHLPSPALTAEVSVMVQEQDPDVVTACIEAMRDRADHTYTIRNLSVPFAVLAGEHDVLAPPSVEAGLAALNPNGQFISIPNAGHVPPLEQQDAFNAALEGVLDSKTW